MIVVMRANATEEQIQNTTEYMQRLGFTVHRSDGVTHTVLGGVGHVEAFEPEALATIDGVVRCVRISSPYKLASRQFRPCGTVLRIGDVALGGESIVVMAGPCCVESAEQIDEVAAHVAASGAAIIRGGAFKPRSSPYSFQGLGADGLRLLRRAAD